MRRRPSGRRSRAAPRRSRRSRCGPTSRAACRASPPAQHRNEPSHVRVHHAVVGLHRVLQQQAVLAEARRCSPAPSRCPASSATRRNASLHARLVGGVEVDGQAGRARGLELAERLLRGGLVAAVPDRDGPAVAGERDRARAADPARGARDHGDLRARSCGASPRRIVQRITVAPHVRPAPNEVNSTRSPSRMRPARQARSSAIGIDAALVFPTSATSIDRLLGGIVRAARRPRFMMRAFAWWGISRSTSSGVCPFFSRTSRHAAAISVTARLNTSRPFGMRMRCRSFATVSAVAGSREPPPGISRISAAVPSAPSTVPSMPGSLAGLDHRRAGAVAEQHARLAVGEVEDAAEHLGADQQDGVGEPGLDERGGGRQPVGEPRARGVHVERGAGHAELALDPHGRGRERRVAGDASPRRSCRAARRSMPPRPSPSARPRGPDRT